MLPTDAEERFRYYINTSGTKSSLKKYHVIIPEVINFNNVPARNPINEPKPDFRASPESFPEVSSPTTAPTNGPTIMPNGGKKNNPIIRPMILPQTPRLLPPNFFVPQAGIT